MIYERFLGGTWSAWPPGTCVLIQMQKLDRGLIWPSPNPYVGDETEKKLWLCIIYMCVCVYVNTDPVYAVLCNNVVCPAGPHGALASNNCEVKQPPT